LPTNAQAGLSISRCRIMIPELGVSCDDTSQSCTSPAGTPRSVARSDLCSLKAVGSNDSDHGDMTMSQMLESVQQTLPTNMDFFSEPPDRGDDGDVNLQDDVTLAEIDLNELSQPAIPKARAVGAFRLRPRNTGQDKHSDEMTSSSSTRNSDPRAPRSRLNCLPNAHTSQDDSVSDRPRGYMSSARSSEMSSSGSEPGDSRSRIDMSNEPDLRDSFTGRVSCTSNTSSNGRDTCGTEQCSHVPAFSDQAVHTDRSDPSMLVGTTQGQPDFTELFTSQSSVQNDVTLAEIAEIEQDGRSQSTMRAHLCGSVASNRLPPRRLRAVLPGTDDAEPAEQGEWSHGIDSVVAPRTRAVHRPPRPPFRNLRPNIVVPEQGPQEPQEQEDQDWRDSTRLPSQGRSNSDGTGESVNSGAAEDGRVSCTQLGPDDSLASFAETDSAASGESEWRASFAEANLYEPRNATRATGSSFP